MSVDKYRPHLFVLPEDDANRQLATGFQLDVDRIRQMYVLKVAGGWMEVLDLFEAIHVREMESNPNRFMLLMVDYDDKLNRLERVRHVIPDNLRNRVFVLGARTTPEALRSSLGLPYERIGSALAGDCRDNTQSVWNHELIRHNADELERLRLHVRPILFT